MRRSLLVIFGLLALAGAARAQSPVTKLHDALHLSSDQEKAWRAYQTAISNPEQAARNRATANLIPTLSTPRRLDLIHAQMEADLAAFDTNAQAVKAFYNTLTPAQQRDFDRETGPAAQNSRG